MLAGSQPVRHRPRGPRQDLPDRQDFEAGALHATAVHTAAGAGAGDGAGEMAAAAAEATDFMTVRTCSFFIPQPSRTSTASASDKSFSWLMDMTPSSDSFLANSMHVAARPTFIASSAWDKARSVGSAGAGASVGGRAGEETGGGALAGASTSSNSVAVSCTSAWLYKLQTRRI